MSEERSCLLPGGRYHEPMETSRFLRYLLIYCLRLSCVPVGVFAVLFDVRSTRALRVLKTRG